MRMNREAFLDTWKKAEKVVATSTENNQIKPSVSKHS